jgi:GNAT superfamily N-acetyltransferase
MLTLLRTNSDNIDFQKLVALLDEDLAIRDGDDHAFYAQFNKVTLINHVVVAYKNNEAIGCGAFKVFEHAIAEIKRMFVLPQHRGEGIAGLVLAELESWAKELHYTSCILETGMKQPEAIRLYQKTGYITIPNYGQYAAVENSVCMQKNLLVSS